MVTWMFYRLFVLTEWSYLVVICDKEVIDSKREEVVFILIKMLT
jgi:hypothetical protein